MTGKQRILAVDDEEKNLKILLLSLGDEWDIKTAKSGEEALEIVGSYKPDLVLLDIMMPGIDGYEVCKKIKSQKDLELTKVLLISGKAMIEERLQGYDAGADDYMTKPFVPEELQAKVEVFLRLTAAEKSLKLLNLNLEKQVEDRTQQLINAEATLINTAKLAALGEMAGGVAHEINTPLATINLIAGQIYKMQENDTLEKDAALDKIQKIIKIVDRISKIIIGLKNFSREADNDSFQSRTLQSILDDTLSLCNEKLKLRSINLIIEPFQGDMLLSCRDVQISQVLLNMLNNAIDAIENLDEKWIKVSFQEDGDFVNFKVTDSGPRISDEVQKKIFQPFFTTKPIGQGTGIGLSISKGLVEDHGGTIYLDKSNPNTSFVIRLPKLHSIEKAA